MNIVEIHTQSGSQYTVITREDGTVLLNVARPMFHALPEHEVHLVTDWHMAPAFGAMVATFTVDAGVIRTSRIVSVRQQIMAGVSV